MKRQIISLSNRSSLRVLRISVVMIAFGVGPSCCESKAAQQQTPTEGWLHLEGYAEIDDIRVYYRVHGSGSPLVLLHGGWGSSERWETYVQKLSRRYRVITPDSRGRGRTSDGSGAITYGRLAGDVVRLLDYLGIDQAHFVGPSEGGITALQLLVDYPDRVRSATLLGTPYHVDNSPPELMAALKRQMDRLRRGEENEVGFKARFERLAPDPSRFLVVVDKLADTWLSQPTFTVDVLRTIKSPVLIVKVDHDEYVPLPVFDVMAKAIPNARIHYIPEGTHVVPFQFPNRVIQAIEDFVSLH